MNANELFRAGKLDEAVSSLNTELREDPSLTRSRVFLFELLCFQGNFERAIKQLDILAGESEEVSMGVLLYRACLNAQMTREGLFANDEYSRLARESSSSESASGVLNEQTFQTLSDSDPRIGPRLEVFAGSEYRLLPFSQIDSLELEPPKLLRNLLWVPAQITVGPTYEGEGLRDVYIPVLYPHTYEREDDAVRLGRATEVCQDEDEQEVLFGQRVLMVDGDEVPLLEIRTLKFDVPGDTTH